MHIQFAEAGFLPAAFKRAGCTGASLGRRLRCAVAPLLVLATVSIIGCKPPPPPPAKPLVANSTDPQWVSQGTPHAKVAVVFVHGIFGDTLGTWTNKNGETFFRLLKTQPRVGDQVDIFAFGFTSNMFKPGSLNIREAANRLHESLQYKEVLDYPAVVFVAHSMGGLVVLEYLLGRRELLEKVPLLVFYATPQEGSQITEIARHVAKNPALAEMLPADKNDYLQRLNDQWRLLPNRPPIVCAYEKLETDGVLIVPWSSATRFCNAAPPAIEADHIRIVKPDRLEHPSLVVLVNALNQHVVGKQLTAKLETPDFMREGDRLVFLLTNPNGRTEARLVNAGGSKLRFTFAQLSDPRLFLWPDDTPRDIAARQTLKMHGALLQPATAPEYRFVLQSDVSPDQVVLVRANFAAMVKLQQEVALSAAAKMTARVAEANFKKFASLPSAAARARAEDELASVARNAYAVDSPNLPEPGQWVLAASLLNALNWPNIARAALRQAEKLSPATARSTSARWLAGAIAAQTGDPRVWSTTETAKLNLEDVPKTQLVGQIVERGQGEVFSNLARQLQQLPALRPYGYSLEGDVWAARGNREAALTSYKAAASLESSPELTRRLKDLESTRSRPRGAVEQYKNAAPSRPTTVPFSSDPLRAPSPSTDTMPQERR